MGKSTRGIPLAQTPEAARQQLKIELGPNSPMRRDVDAELAKSRSSSNRTKSGGAFQRELVRTHAWYLKRGVALIRQHHPAVHGVPAIVDRAGHVIRPGTLHFEAAGAPCDFGGIAAVAGKVRGVLFDAKVITGVATYAHLEKQYHQLEELQHQQRLHGIAFLLLADQELGIAYLVEELAPLLARETITLRDTPRLGSKKVALEAMAHRYPFVRRPPDFSPVSSYARWDWLSLMEELYAKPHA